MAFLESALLVAIFAIPALVMVGLAFCSGGAAGSVEATSPAGSVRHVTVAGTGLPDWSSTLIVKGRAWTGPHKTKVAARVKVASTIHFRCVVMTLSIRSIP